jgi:hypothetical protein
MNERITQFERLWLSRPPLPRIMAFDQAFPMPCPLVRQTNQHHLLSPNKLEKYWSANAAEKATLLATLSPGPPLTGEEVEEIMRHFR